MVSFWPSLTLLAFFLVVFLECRLLAGRATIPLGGFLPFFAYGCVGAALFSLLLQQLPFLQFTAVSNAQGTPVWPAAWLTGPPIEELAKIVPVILLGFLTSAWRRLSIADLTLAGFASGAGFGFVEGNLEALVDGKLPGAQHVLLLGYQSAHSAAGDYAVYFAGHAVYPALFALAVGIGLRLWPIKRFAAWIPAAIVFLIVCFDHGMYNWKLLHPAAGGFAQAPLPLEYLYLATFHGALEIWLLPLGLFAAQFAEARLCSQILGMRGDMLLPSEAGRWVVNEWYVALLRVPYGCAAFDQTLAYFRRRRAFALATLEVTRNPGNRTLSQYTLLLEQRLLQERALLATPPRGTWFPPRATVLRDLKGLAWRMRWVWGFAVLFVLLFMLGIEHMPQWLRGILFGDVFTLVVVELGLWFAVWRVYGFLRAPPLDPVASEGAAYAEQHMRVLLLGASLASGVSPALAILFGWKAIAPGAAYLSGNFAGWIGQGGNLYAMMGLGAMGGAIEAEPGPVGGALRDEIEAGAAQIRRLERQIQRKITLALPGQGEISGHLKLEELIALTARLDAERDMQGRRIRALESCERQEVEGRVEDFGAAIDAVKQEFEQLRVQFDDAADEERRRLAAFEQGFNRYLAPILNELDSYDAAHRALFDRIVDLWRPKKDMDWALRVAQYTDDASLLLLKNYIADIEGWTRQAYGDRATILDAGLARIRSFGTAAFVRPEEPVPSEVEDTPEAEVVADARPSEAEPEHEELQAELETADDIAADGAPADLESAPEIRPEPLSEAARVESVAPASDTEDFWFIEPALSSEPIRRAVPAPECAAATPVAPRMHEEFDIEWVTLETPEEAPSVAQDFVSEPLTEPAVQAVETVVPEAELAPVESVEPQSEASKPAWDALNELLNTIKSDLYDHLGIGASSKKTEPVEPAPPPAPVSQEAPVQTALVEEIAPPPEAAFETPQPAADVRLDWATPQIEDATPPPLSGVAPGWAFDDFETAAGIPAHFASEHFDEHSESDHREVAFQSADFEEPWHAHVREFADLSRHRTPLPVAATAEIALADRDLPRVEDKTRVWAYVPASTALPPKQPDVLFTADPDLARVEDKTKIVPYQPVSTALPAPNPENYFTADPELLRTEDKTKVAAYQPASTELPAKKPEPPVQPAPVAPAPATAATPVLAKPTPPIAKAPEAKPAPSKPPVAEAKPPSVKTTPALAPATKAVAPMPPAAAAPVKPAPAKAAPAKPATPPSADDGIDLWRQTVEGFDLDDERLGDKDVAIRTPFDLTAPVKPAAKPSAPTEQKATPAAKPAGPSGKLFGIPRAPKVEPPAPAKPAETILKPSAPASKSAGPAPTGSASFRPTKFYGSASSGKADGEASDAEADDKKTARPQSGYAVSIRSAKFYNNAKSDINAADRTPETANANAVAAGSAKSPLADALTDYFTRNGETPPPMQTVDSETLSEVVGSGRLETAKRGASPWSFSGIPRRGDFAIRLKPGSDRYVEFVASNVTFGQSPRYYPRRVGVGTAQTYIPIEHLEYFDPGARQWQPLKA